METTQIKTNAVGWENDIFTSNAVKVFECNVVMFLNSGTANIIINTTFVLLPGASFSLGCNQNEVDVTSYRFTFPTFGGILNVWYKRDKGIFIPGQFDQYRDVVDLSKIPDKAEEDKKFIRERYAYLLEGGEGYTYEQIDF